MATLNPKLYGQASGSPSGQQAPVQLMQRGEVKTGRVRPLSSMATSVRNATAVVIDAVMGRYDR